MTNLILLRARALRAARGRPVLRRREGRLPRGALRALPRRPAADARRSRAPVARGTRLLRELRLDEHLARRARGRRPARLAGARRGGGRRGARCCSPATATCSSACPSACACCTRAAARTARSVIGPAEVRERYGIEPAQVPDFIALRGDPSDGLPGAKGIGEKSARDLLREHGTLRESSRPPKAGDDDAPHRRRADRRSRAAARLPGHRHAARGRPSSARPTPRLDCRARPRAQPREPRDEPAVRAAGEARGRGILTAPPRRDGTDADRAHAVRLYAMISAVRLPPARGFAPCSRFSPAWRCPRRRRLPTRPLPCPSSRAGSTRPIPAMRGRGWAGSPAAARRSWRAVAVPQRLERQPRRGGLRRHGRLVPRDLQRAAHPARHGLGTALRAGPAQHAGVAQRPSDRRQPGSVHAVRAARARASDRAANTLVVRVDNRRPETLREGWWNWGGITRPVSLDPARAAGRCTTSACSPASAARTATVAGACSSTGGSRTRPPPTSSPRSPSRCGHPTATLSTGVSQPRRAAPRRAAARALRRTGDGRREGVVTRGARSSTAATVTTSAGDTVAQVDRERIGLRTIEVKDATLYLNGRALDLRGASIQEDVPGRGPALTDADVERIVERAQGAERQRHARALPARRAPARPLRRGGHPRLEPGARLPPRQAARDAPGSAPSDCDVLRDTILAARNHPSVITHSVANELSSVPDKRPDDEGLDARRRAAARATSTRRSRCRSTCSATPAIDRQTHVRALRPARDQLVLRLVRGQARRTRPQTSATSRRTCARCTPSTRARRS